MKLISLNMEGIFHLELVEHFIAKHQPECLALQEIPESFLPTLTKLGYYTTFAPMAIEEKGGIVFTGGIAIATLTPHTSKTVHYFGNTGAINKYIREDQPNTVTYPYISALVRGADETEYQIATIHMIVTEEGRANPEQNNCCEALLDLIGNEPPHILCGDFNMPRGYNTNYERFTARYTDAIPPKYGSSLDRTYHRAASEANLHAPIFDIYMVDYIFTQPPYQAENVHLQFGVSDHAAVIADISKK